jgi:hypothetical protein
VITVNVRYLALALVLTLATQTIGYSQDSKSWWNPFASSSSSSSSSKTRDSQYFSNNSGMKMPEFKMSTWGTSNSKPKKKQPSAMSRMSSTTKRWWDNTVDFMNPFDNKPAPKPKSSYHSQKQPTENKGMFSWMWQEEKTESPTTVKEFLRNPRPGLNDNYAR